MAMLNLLIAILSPQVRIIPDEQALLFMGKSLPPGSQYYSKAGWTSSTRHDSAFIRLPNGAEYVAVVFTRNNSKQDGIIPLVSKLLAEHFLDTKPTADTILTNGRFWTGVAASPWAEALAMRGERIIAVGTRADVAKLAASSTRTIDLGGKLALPVSSTRTRTSLKAAFSCFRGSPGCQNAGGVPAAYCRAEPGDSAPTMDRADRGITRTGPEPRCQPRNSSTR